METITFTRKELYDLVWSKPLSAIAKEHQIKFLDLKKACNENDIPLPENGYWSKLKFGKAVRVIELPMKSEDDGKSIVVINKEEKKKADLIKKIKEIDSGNKKSEPISNRLSEPDILVVKARENLKGKKPSYGENFIYTDADHLRIYVAPHNVQRALRIADLIIKLFKSLGIEVRIKSYDNVVVVSGEELAFSIQEKTIYQSKVNKYGYSERESVGTDIMTFRYWVASETSYIDKRIIADGIKPLEEKLPNIISGLESLAQKEKDRKQELERYWAEQREKKRIETERIKKEREVIRQQKQDDENFETLLNQAQRWQQSKIVREYLQEIESQAKKYDELTPELIEWLKWAKEKTNMYDPLKY